MNTSYPVELVIKKLSAICVPSKIGNGSKASENENVSRDSRSNRFNSNETEFVCRFVTTDETWVPYYTPQTNQQTKQ